MGQFETVSEEDARGPEVARNRDRKKKKLHYNLMKQMRELHGEETDTELDELEDISVPSAPRPRTKRMKLEVSDSLV